MRTDQRIDRVIAERVIRRVSIRAGRTYLVRTTLYPLVPVLRRRIHISSAHIRTVIGTRVRSGPRPIVVYRRREGNAAIKRGYGADAPATQSQIHSLVGAAAELSAMPERNIEVLRDG